MHTCRHCDETKSIAEFWNPVNRRHATWCSVCLDLRRAGLLHCKSADCSSKIYSLGMCRAHYERSRYADRREAHLKYLRRRYAADPERFLAANKRWAEANKERKAAADAAWREGNRERKRKTDAANYAKRREEIKTRSAEWYAANKDRANANSKAWREANPDKRQEHQTRRRALKAGVVARLTAAEWRQILAEFDYTCAYCQARGVDLDQEHMTPVSRGGHHDRNNVVPACKPCNGRKKTRTIFEFLAVA